MGCTSSKPKRTTSIEDVASKAKEPTNQLPDKNGQVNKAPEKILREKDSSKTTSETNAIEIPGAHKSFMAPDGIPFIDEDVESELDDVSAQPAPSAANDFQKGKKHGSPDQNKNVTIVVNKEVKGVANADAAVTATKPSALRESAPSHEESRKETVTSEPVVISDIKVKEVQITTTKNQETDSSEARNRRTLTDDKSKTEEELAATKIQAGIRGFLDRQKVKAIRANVQHPTEGQEHHKDSTQQQSGPKVTVHMEETDLEVDGPHDPKLDTAATKIQANYRGYRIRKNKKTHSK